MSCSWCYVQWRSMTRRQPHAERVHKNFCRLANCSRPRKLGKIPKDMMDRDKDAIVSRPAGGNAPDGLAWPQSPQSHLQLWKCGPQQPQTACLRSRRPSRSACPPQMALAPARASPLKTDDPPLPDGNSRTARCCQQAPMAFESGRSPANPSSKLSVPPPDVPFILRDSRNTLGAAAAETLSKGKGVITACQCSESPD